MDKIGIFLCSGCEIDSAIKLDGLQAVANENGISTTINPCLCSPEGVAAIRKAVDDGQINGVLIGACSPRAKSDEFRFDPTKVAVERVSLREHVAWSHEPGNENTQALAEDLLRMGIAKIQKMNLAKPAQEAIEDTVLVVGGGLAGLCAAEAASGLGKPVVLVEAKEELGGYLAGVTSLVPEIPPYEKPASNHLSELIAKVTESSKVRVLTSCKIKQISGQPGQFDVEVESAQGAQKFKAGAIVQATGARPYDAHKLPHLGYGKFADVITSHQLEQMLKQGKLLRPSNKQAPKRVLFVQCAGSRDPDHLPYCSSECCATSLKQVSAIHKSNADVECLVVYRDLRAPGQLERFYLGVQEEPGSLFVRGVVDKVENGGGQLKVTVGDSMLGKDSVLTADLVVLAVGMVPNSADGEALRKIADAKVRVEKNESEVQVAEAKKQIEELKRHEGTEILNLVYRQGPDLPALRYDFPDSHYICFPYETRRTGIYSAGAVHAPMDAAQAADDGWGAAMKAVQCIEANKRSEALHPRAGDVSVADFFLQRCTQCKRCTEECPFGSLNEDVKGTPQYNQLRCRRCGICLGACPERIISFPEFSVDAVSSMVKAISVPEDYEEKPRIIAFMCENDAYPALDEAAAKRIQWNPWVRIIPVRCLGAVNIIWVADSLSRGIDGLILLGCKSGDDYQCHYMRGSELAQTRFGNIQETLNRLALEPERIRIVELARNEFERAPQILDEFSQTLQDLGANPLKGF
ncbi:MAG: hydrogenase iron-sulfur subunit [Deltaproteobacteria bacterium]|nr:hydrogenase iron-sulfur subunit [Deltaproteobacteria bacterium]